MAINLTPMFYTIQGADLFSKSGRKIDVLTYHSWDTAILKMWKTVS
jgi:hypothetical protein